MKVITSLDSANQPRRASYSSARPGHLHLLLLLQGLLLSGSRWLMIEAEIVDVRHLLSLRK